MCEVLLIIGPAVVIAETVKISIFMEGRQPGQPVGKEGRQAIMELSR